MIEEKQRLEKRERQLQETMARWRQTSQLKEASLRASRVQLEDEKGQLAAEKARFADEKVRLAAQLAESRALGAQHIVYASYRPIDNIS